MATTPGAVFTYGAALTNTQQRLGYLVNQIESFPTLGTTPPTAPFIGNNADRVGLIIVNVSLNPVFIGVSQATVQATNGILLNPSGGAVTMQVRDDWTLPSSAWWGEATGGSAQIYVLELIGWKALPPGTVPGV